MSHQDSEILRGPNADDPRTIATTDSPILCSVTWGTKDAKRNLSFTAGRYLIGDSAFATIRISSTGTNLCGALFVSPEKISIKCTGPQPVMFVDGRRLQIGESVILGDVMELIIAATRVVISSHVGQSFIHAAEEKPLNRLEIETKDFLTYQDEVNSCGGDPDRIRIVLSKVDLRASLRRRG